MPGWAPPGKEAHPGRWRYDLRKGFVPPGHPTDPAGTQYEMHDGFDPQGAPRGFHVVESPPGTAAPIGAINYTPETREVHDVGMLAPVDKRNLSLVPDSGLHRLAYARRQQMRQAVGQGMGVGHDDTARFAGAPPISNNFPTQPAPTFQQPAAQPNSGTSPTSSPPGSPWGRQPLGIGAGQDDATDPLAGGGSPPSGGYSAGATIDPSTGGVDIGGAPAVEGPGVPATAVSSDFTGQKQLNDNTVVQYESGQEIGRWIKKPGSTDVDPNAWTFRATPNPRATSQANHVVSSESRPDGSTLLHWSNGNQTVVSPPKSPKEQAGVQYGKPYRDEAGNLVQTGSNGEIRVIERNPTSTRAPQVTWGTPYQDPSTGAWVQKSSTGELRAAPTPKPPTAATEKWGPLDEKPDGSVWQQNTDTGAWTVRQAPTRDLGVPFAVGNNRLVQFDKDTNTYKEVYRAPANLSLQTLDNGSIVGINQETGDVTPILDDPTAAAKADLAQRKGEQGLRSGEADIQRTQMGMIPQPFISGGNLIVPEGAEADVTDWNPLTGQTSSYVSGHHRSVPDILQSYGFDQPPPTQAAPSYSLPAASGGSSVSSSPEEPPGGTLAPPGVAGTQADPVVQADTAGYTPPPDTGPQGGTDWLFSSPASPVPNPANTPQPAPAEEAPTTEETPPEDDAPPEDGDLGAGAERKRSKQSQDDQGDLMSDIPRFAKKKRWKGLGSKFLGRGLDDFQPFVGVGQDGSTDPAAGPPSPSPTPAGASAGPILPAGGPAGAGPGGSWNPQQLQQLLPLLLMLLSGGSGSGPQGVGSPPAPAPTAPATPPSPGGVGAAAPPMGSGLGMGQDQGFDPNEYVNVQPDVFSIAPGSAGHQITGYSGGQEGGEGAGPGGRYDVGLPPSQQWGDLRDYPVMRPWNITPGAANPNATEFDPSTVLRPTESGPTQVGSWREAGPWILGGSPEGGPTMLPQMPGESGPSMLDTSPVSSQVFPEDLLRGRFRNLGQLDQSWMGDRYPGGYAGTSENEYMNPDFFEKYGPGDLQEGQARRNVLGTGQDQPRGRWHPPIDPAQVVGTGHMFGEAMSVGDPQHRGVDLQAPKGTPVKAPVDGVVRINHNPQGLGLEAVIISPDGKEHKLGHLDTVHVKPGQQVRAGQPIGTVGDSGMTTGSHLHYAERKGGRYFDPSKKMGVLASMDPVPGTQMMTQDSGGGDADAGAGHGIGSGAEAQRIGVGAGGMRLANGKWSDALADTPENQARYGIGSGFQGSVGYGGAQSAPAGGGGGGGGGGGTQVGIDPATKARLQLDTQVAQWKHDNDTATLQQSARAEDDRHAEELTRLQQAATQEADWRAVQDAVNAENTRHNQVQEQIAQKQQALDLQLEQMKEQSAMRLQQESERFQAGQTAQSNALSTMQTALNNPWLQALAKLGITPGGGASSGQNPLMSLINAVLGGNTGGNLANTGAFAGSANLPQVTAQQWAQMSVPQRAAMRAQVEAMGPGAWEQFQANFQNQAGSQAPDQTQLQSAISSPEDQIGTQMNAEMFGEGMPAFQQRQQQNWNKAQGTNVMQSLLAGTGFG